MDVSFLNRRPWRRLRQVLLPFSAGAFFLIAALLLSDSPLLHLGAGFVGPYSMVVGLDTFLFPLSIGLNLAAKKKLSSYLVVILVVVCVIMFSIAVPIVPVQKPYPVHCGGSFTEWQSISYNMFGFGSHFDLGSCL